MYIVSVFCPYYKDKMELICPYNNPTINLTISVFLPLVEIPKNFRALRAWWKIFTGRRTGK